MPIKGLIKKKMDFLSKQVNALSSRIRIRAPGHCRRGGTLDAEIALELKNPIEARSLEARLVCIEVVRTKTVREMDVHDYREERELGVHRTTHLRTETSLKERVAHSERKRLAGHGKYESGAYHVEFHLPPSAPPTRHAFGHDGKKALWKLEAKLDIPLAPDIRASKEIIVE